jgi:uncharacterized protein YjbI with pentapeptide repeats
VGVNPVANKQHLSLLKQGINAWNVWRREYPKIQPILSGADLSETTLVGFNLSRANLSAVDLSGATLIRADLSRADLSGATLFKANLSETSLFRANLSDANLSGANLSRAICCRAILSRATLRKVNLSRADLSGAILSDTNLSGATLNGADLSEANLIETNLSGANLSRCNLTETDCSNAVLLEANLSETTLSDANLFGANLNGANLSDAILNRADLSRATLIGTNLSKALLTDCRIYGISAWDVRLEGAAQFNLVVTPQNEPSITVDNLKVAQFIYLLLNNEEIRDVIDTITSKAVLILGRFTSERKAVLDALRDALRSHGYLPIVFDFEKPASRDITETVSTLAHMSQFVIADITDAKSIPQELMSIVPNLPSVAVQPLILNSQHEYGMFEHFTRFPWVLPLYSYTDEKSLLASLYEKVIYPAERKAKELANR